MKFLFILALTLPIIQGKLLFHSLGARLQDEKCHPKSFLSCEKVELDMDALVNDEKVSLPLGFELIRYIGWKKSSRWRDLTVKKQDK